MKVEVSFLNLDSSPALKKHASLKFTEKVQKYVTKPEALHVRFSQEGLHRKIHADLRAGDGFGCTIEKRGDNLHALVDKAASRMGRQLKRHKEQLKAHHKAPKVIEFRKKGRGTEIDGMESADDLPDYYGVFSQIK